MGLAFAIHGEGRADILESAGPFGGVRLHQYKARQDADVAQFGGQIFRNPAAVLAPELEHGGECLGRGGVFLVKACRALLHHGVGWMVVEIDDVLHDGVQAGAGRVTAGVGLGHPAEQIVLEADVGPDRIGE